MYEHGRGVAKNLSKAAELYQKAVEQGDNRAENNLGYMYEIGEGMPKDFVKAMDLYRKSAAAGNVAAIYNVGYMYEQGEGGKRDYQEAVRWFRMAADRGDKDATAEIANVQKMAAQAGHPVTLPSAGQSPPAPAQAPPAQVAAAPAPAPATPAATPAAASNTPPPQDDPVGAGGVISPPASYRLLLCIEQSLATNEVFNAPYPGSKMDTVKGMIARYIVSTAKPDWLYMLRRQEYDTFAPSANADPSKLVLAVSPADHDVFNPRCPSGYAGYNVQINR